MTTVITSAAITAILFVIASFAISESWTYYVPAFLILTVTMLHFINSRNETIAKSIIAKHSDSLLEIEKRMLLSSPSLLIPHLTLSSTFAKVDGSSAGIVVSFLGAIATIVFAVLGRWTPAILSFLPLVYLWKKKLPAMFLSNDPQRDAERAAWRLDGFTIPDDQLQYLCEAYRELVKKLERLFPKK